MHVYLLTDFKTRCVDSYENTTFIVSWFSPPKEDSKK